MVKHSHQVGAALKGKVFKPERQLKGQKLYVTCAQKICQEKISGLESTMKGRSNHGLIVKEKKECMLSLLVLFQKVARI